MPSAFLSRSLGSNCLCHDPVLAALSAPHPRRELQMTSLGRPDLLVAGLAYCVGALIAVFPIHMIVKLTWDLVEVESLKAAIREAPETKPFDALKVHYDLARYVWQGDLVGAVERLLYITAILLQRAEFIAVWLTLKTVSRSPGWTRDKWIKGRGIFNNFLIGNGISILFSFIGVELAILFVGSKWQRDCASAWAITLLVVLIFAVTWLWLHCRLEKKWKEVASKVDPDSYLEIRGKPHPSLRRPAPA
jgi:hypothetical protein